MDKLNRFHSRGTYRLLRLDYFVVMLALAGFVLAHASSVNWTRFWLAFWWIDIVGTLPAYYVYYLRRRGEHRSISPRFYTLYNFAHSYTTNAVVIGVWYLLSGELELAMLAVPIHIFGDRSLFGNVYKSPTVSFEPVAHEEFATFDRRLQESSRW